MFFNQEREIPFHKLYLDSFKLYLFHRMLLKTNDITNFYQISIGQNLIFSHLLVTISFFFFTFIVFYF